MKPIGNYLLVRNYWNMKKSVIIRVKRFVLTLRKVLQCQWWNDLAMSPIAETANTSFQWWYRVQPVTDKKNSDLSVSLMKRTVTCPCHWWKEQWLVLVTYEKESDFSVSLMKKTVTYPCHWWKEQWLILVTDEKNSDLAMSLMKRTVTCPCHWWKEQWLVLVTDENNSCLSLIYSVLKEEPLLTCVFVRGIMKAFVYS